MKVVLTAPIPGSSTPSFPFAGAILEGFSMQLLLKNDRYAINTELDAKSRIGAAETRCILKQTSNDEGSAQDLQIHDQQRLSHQNRRRESFPEAAAGCCERSRQGSFNLAPLEVDSRVKVKQRTRGVPAEEPPMKFTGRYGRLLIVLVVLALAATVFGVAVSAQDEVWRIVRADSGYKNQRADVTEIVNDLVVRGGVNGRVTVSNQTMGGDPAVGKDKSLRIVARNRRNEEREFSFNEGSFVDVRMFNARRERDDWDDRPGNNVGRDDWNRFQIIRAYYGISGRTINVTELLRGRARDGRIDFVVTNSALGGDPAVGADKLLIVIYRYQGQEAATFVREGNTLTIP
jgi:hypothetical protein